MAWLSAENEGAVAAEMLEYVHQLDGGVEWDPGWGTENREWTLEENLQAPEEDWSFRSLEDGTCEITSCLRAEPFVKVPAFYGVVPVGAIGEMAFSPRKPKITKRQAEERLDLYAVALPDTVHTLSSGAFAGCRNLTRLYVPESVLTIQAGALLDCSSLVVVTPAHSNAALWCEAHRIPWMEPGGAAPERDPMAGLFL